jgi:hypothetical protein
VEPQSRETLKELLGSWNVADFKHTDFSGVNIQPSGDAGDGIESQLDGDREPHLNLLFGEAK